MAVLKNKCIVLTVCRKERRKAEAEEAHKRKGESLLQEEAIGTFGKILSLIILTLLLC